MISRIPKFPVVALLVASIVVLERPGTARQASSSAASVSPSLIDICLITTDVPRLLDFYGQVLRIRPKTTGTEYAEFSTGVGVLAIFSAEAQEKYIPHSAEPASNRTAILEFRVSDVDKEYARLQGIVKTWIKAPTTQPWGTRSIYFRDPDGNLVNFFARVQNK